MKDATILVIDDEADLRELVRITLARAGYAVRVAADGVAGIEAFFEVRPQLVVLDVAMPRLDGWGVLERIRESSEVPVIMLTARTTEIDKVRGLRSGADDYLTKPFGRQELAARVEALLRRAGTARAVKARRSDGFATIDFEQRLATIRGTEIPFTPLEFRLFATLVEHAGEVLSPARLRELVWNDPDGVAQDQVKLYIGYVRRKLVAAGIDDPIETIRGNGYRYRKPAN